MRIEGPSDRLRGIDSFGAKAKEPSKGELRGLESFRKRKSTEEAVEDIGETALDSVIDDPRKVEAPPKREIVPGERVVQRDSGQVYEIEDIVEERNGRIARLRVRDSEGNAIRSVNLRPEDLEAKLSMTNGPWSWA